MRYEAAKRMKGKLVTLVTAWDHGGVGVKVRVVDVDELGVAYIEEGSDLLRFRPWTTVDEIIAPRPKKEPTPPQRRKESNASNVPNRPVQRDRSPVGGPRQDPRDRGGRR